jgi:hypothetical protein
MTIEINERTNIGLINNKEERKGKIMKGDINVRIIKNNKLKLKLLFTKNK